MTTENTQEAPQCQPQGLKALPIHEEVRNVLYHMEQDPTGGMTVLGSDGVVRSFTDDSQVVDAVGLPPRLIKAFLDLQEWSAENEQVFRGVDGTNVSREQMFNPAEKDRALPVPEEYRIRGEEEKRKAREIYEARRAKILAGTDVRCPLEILSDHRIE